MDLQANAAPLGVSDVEVHPAQTPVHDAATGRPGTGGSSAVEALTERLQVFRGRDVFNQYAEVHPDYDHPDGAERRCANMRLFLDQFRDAGYVLISEAPGYAGARFSGVSFTDERFLVGPDALPWAGERAGYRRASRDELPLRREMSATIVWGAVGMRRDIIFWPSFPWHPMGTRGPMSNRPPRRDELDHGREVLAFFLRELFPGRVVGAVGRYGEAALRTLGYSNPLYLRHPAQGGATAFRAGIAALPILPAGS